VARERNNIFFSIFNELNHIISSLGDKPLSILTAKQEQYLEFADVENVRSLVV
jgi:hypothetical protein